MSETIEIGGASSMLWRTMGYFYFGLVTFYSILALAILVNVVRQLFHRAGQRRRRIPYDIRVNERRYAMHLLAGFGLMLVVLVPAAQLSLSPTVRWWILPMTISAISYYSGWRSANIGVIVGSLGTMFSLMIYSWLSPEVAWVDTAPKFLLLNLLGNLSGWVGAFVGRGQIREGQCISEFVVHFAPGDRNIAAAFIELRDIVAEEFKDCWPGRIQRDRLANKQIRVADQMGPGSGSYLVSYSDGYRWGYKYNPMLRGIKWAFWDKTEVHSFNEICSHVYNFWRYAFCSVQIHTGANDDPGIFRIIVKNYWEIPAIVYIDDRSCSSADRIHAAVSNFLENEHPSQIQLQSQAHWAIRNWEQKPLLEQVAIVTPGGTRTCDQIVPSLCHVQDHAPPHRILNEFETSLTFFDRFRGKASTIVFFIITQVFLGWALGFLAKIMGT